MCENICIYVKDMHVQNQMQKSPSALKTDMLEVLSDFIKQHHVEYTSKKMT